MFIIGACILDVKDKIYEMCKNLLRNLGQKAKQCVMIKNIMIPGSKGGSAKHGTIRRYHYWGFLTPISKDAYMFMMTMGGSKYEKSSNHRVQ